LDVSMKLKNKSLSKSFEMECFVALDVGMKLRNNKLEINVKTNFKLVSLIYV